MLGKNASFLVSGLFFACCIGVSETKTTTKTRGSLCFQINFKK